MRIYTFLYIIILYVHYSLTMKNFLKCLTLIFINFYLFEVKFTKLLKTIRLVLEE